MTPEMQKRPCSGQAKASVRPSAMPTPEEIIAQSRHLLAQTDDDELLKALIAASVNVVLKAHRMASQKLDRLAAQKRAAAIAAWGEKHAWRECAAPSVAKLADIIAEFDRRNQIASGDAEDEIEVAPFEVELVGAEGASLTITEKGAS